MSVDVEIIKGQVYGCLICGAEVTVIQGATGRLAPRCCNEPMVLLETLARVFRCPICGAEVTVIREGEECLEPRCCNQPMVLISS